MKRPPKLKYPPRGCSVPRRICILCQKTPIHKNDARYDSRICFSCVPFGTSINQNVCAVGPKARKPD